MGRCAIASTSEDGKDFPRSAPLLVRQSIILFLFGLSILAGCQSGGPATDEQQPADKATYQIKGIVVSSDAAKGAVTLDTEAIPGFMGAMIMPYKLAQPGVATELEKVYNVPAPGQTVPNFKFLNQDGKTIDIHQYRGKVLLVTFIYTRCPLPDYCIRMSRNFATVQHQLAADPQLYNKTHLLSVSFDPAHDTPKVLRSYGASYTGDHGGEAFSHWDFAAPSSSDLDAADQFFDVGVSPGSNNTLTHSLSTAIIAPSGKIFRWYPSNEWTPSAVVDDIRQAIAQ
jgi:protein SCO1